MTVVEALVHPLEFIEPVQTVGVDRPDFAPDAVAIASLGNHAGIAPEIVERKSRDRLSLANKCLSGEVVMVAGPAFQSAIDENQVHGAVGASPVAGGETFAGAGSNSITTAVVLSRPEFCTDSSTRCWARLGVEPAGDGVRSSSSR